MRFLACGISAAVFAFSAMPSFAQQPAASKDVVKIGVLGDFSGIFENLSGKGALEAVKMAVEDFGGTVLGKKIEVISADHQNKPDIPGENVCRAV